MLLIFRQSSTRGVFRLLRGDGSLLLAYLLKRSPYLGLVQVAEQLAAALLIEGRRWL